MILKLKKFHWHEIPIFINDIDINKKVVSNKVPLGKENFKYFLATDAKKRLWCMLRPVHIKEILIKTKCM